MPFIFVISSLTDLEVYQTSKFAAFIKCNFSATGKPQYVNIHNTRDVAGGLAMEDLQVLNADTEDPIVIGLVNFNFTSSFN